MRSGNDWPRFWLAIIERYTLNIPGPAIISVGRGLSFMAIEITIKEMPKISSARFSHSAFLNVICSESLGVTKKTDLPNADLIDDFRLTNIIEPYKIIECSKYQASEKIFFSR